MSKTVTIDVTQKDIDEGEPADCHCCPIALAAARVFPLSWFLTVDTDGIFLDTETIPIPDIAIEFIESVDAGGDVRPFAFTISVPDYMPEEAVAP